MTLLVRTRIVLAVTAALLSLGATVPSAAAVGPTFKLPLPCRQIYVGSTYAGHGLAVDFNQRRGNDAGDPVLASASGIVSDASQIPVNGQITIDHGGGWQTVYAHMSGIGVREGQRVVAGHILGYVDDAGYASGEHLHYEQKFRDAVVQSRFEDVPYEYGKRIRSTNCSIRPSAIATFYEYGNGAGRIHAWRSKPAGPSRPAGQRVIVPV